MNDVEVEVLKQKLFVAMDSLRHMFQEIIEAKGEPLCCRYWHYESTNNNPANWARTCRIVHTA